MKAFVRIGKRWLPAALAALALVSSALVARAAAPLESALEAARIVVVDGREVEQPVSSVKPGDTLKYHARYRNTGATPLAQVAATLPIPAGTQIVLGNSAREGAQASLDGVRFQPMPLTRRVRNAEGQWQTVAVPLAEYKAVRWPARTLAAGEGFDVSLRVQVIDTPSNAKVTP